MADITASNIDAVLRSQLDAINTSVESREVGTVAQVGDGIARVEGLRGAMAGELLEFETADGSTIMGLALNLDESGRKPYKHLAQHPSTLGTGDGIVAQRITQRRVASDEPHHGVELRRHVVDVVACCSRVEQHGGVRPDDLLGERSASSHSGCPPR